MIHFWLSLLLYVYFKCLSIIIIQFEKFPRHQFKRCWLMIVVASLSISFFLRNCSNYISSFSEDKGSLVKGFSGNVDCINMLEVLFAFWCCELKNKNVCGSRCSWSNKGSHKCDNSNFSFKKLKSSCYMS